MMSVGGSSIPELEWSNYVSKSILYQNQIVYCISETDCIWNPGHSSMLAELAILLEVGATLQPATGRELAFTIPTCLMSNSIQQVHFNRAHIVYLCSLYTIQERLD